MHEALVRQYANANLAPERHANYLRLSALKRFWAVDEVLAALQTLTPATLQVGLPSPDPGCCGCSLWWPCWAVHCLRALMLHNAPCSARPGNTCLMVLILVRHENRDVQVELEAKTARSFGYGPRLRPALTRHCEDHAGVHAVCAVVIWHATISRSELLQVCGQNERLAVRAQLGWSRMQALNPAADLLLRRR